MLGTIVNTVAIIVGSLLGVSLRRGISDKYKETVIGAIGLAVLLIGLKSALQTDALLLVIFSLALGAVIGEILHIEDRLGLPVAHFDRFAQILPGRFHRLGAPDDFDHFIQVVQGNHQRLENLENLKIGAYLHDNDYWFDCGKPETLLKAEKHLDKWNS